MKGITMNCIWGYKCLAIWGELAFTANKNIRFCQYCEREVHRCKSHKELLVAVSLNQCVNFPSSLIEIAVIDESGKDSENFSLTGMPLPTDSELTRWAQCDSDIDIPF